MNLGARATGYAFVVFLFSSLAWILFGFAGQDYGLVAQNVALSIINVVGIYRYLFRQ